MKRVRLALTFAASTGMMAVAYMNTAIAQTSQQVQDGVNAIGGQSSPSLDNTLQSGINTFLYIIGALAIIMIIYGGFKYITSAGDSTGVTSAKNTIMYAVIGLIVTVLAGFIANFAVTAFESESLVPSDCTDARGEPC